MVQMKNNCFCHSIPVRKLAHVSFLTGDSGFDGSNRVLWSSQPAGVCLGQHGQIIQMVAYCQYLRGTDSKLACDFGQGSAFVVSVVAEPRIDVIAHDGQMWNAAAVSAQIFMNDLGIAAVSRDQAKR